MNSKGPIGRDLVNLGLINESQLEVALGFQKKRKERLGEILLALRMVSEIDILRLLSQRLGVPYVTSHNLSSLNVPERVLTRLPVLFRERSLVIPIAEDPELDNVIVVTHSPENEYLMQETTEKAKCRDVWAYLAMKPTLRAGIRRFFHDDNEAFKRIESGVFWPGAILGFTAGLDLSANISNSRPADIPGLRLNDELIAESFKSGNYFVDTVNILVALNERNNPERKGHSSRVARLAKNMSEKLGLLPSEVFINVVAANLHEIGKLCEEHHTLMSLADEGQYHSAQKNYQAPVRLVESTCLPHGVIDILTHAFERMDGKGFPDGLTGDAIPLGSRILAVADAYEEQERMIGKPGTSRAEHLKAMFAFQSTYFDRRVLKVLFETLQEMPVTAQPSTQGDELRVLIIDPAGNTHVELIKRIQKLGCIVRIARDTDAVGRLLKKNRVDAILTELETRPLNAMQMCHAIKSNQAMEDTLFVIMAPGFVDQETELVAKEVGADDFIHDSLNLDVAFPQIEKHLKMLLEERGPSQPHVQQTISEETTQAQTSAISGNLKVISLPDILQMLSASQQTGMIRLRWNGDKEAAVFIEDGMVINCFHQGLTGEPAFYKLLEQEEGDFIFETDVTIPERTISMPTENLMLEGFRILDENRAGIKH